MTPPNMTEYFVSWHIEVDADSPEEAAQKALDIQRDSTSTATVFNVTELGKGKGKLTKIVDLGFDPRLIQ